jgi:hypothetical protein
MTTTNQAFFGSGSLWGVGADALKTPVQFGTLQDVSLDFSFTEKELRGQRIFPEKIGRAEGKLTGKAKFGRINPQLFATLYGGTLSTGRTLVASGEKASIPSSTSYNVTVANSSKFVTDLGVVYADSGKVMQKVASGDEAEGAYSVDTDTGKYTFAEDDKGVDVLVSYSYTDSDGHTITGSNDLAGVIKGFQVVLSEHDDEGDFGVRLFSCTSSKLSLATKMGDFMIPELDFSAAADDAGNVYKIWSE